MQAYSQGEPFDDLTLPGSIKEKQSMTQGDVESVLVPNESNFLRIFSVAKQSKLPKMIQLVSANLRRFGLKGAELSKTGSALDGDNTE